MAGHGGSTKAAAQANGKRVGRPPRVPDADDVKVGKGFASQVLARLKELKLKAKNGSEIKTAEDYALDMLASKGTEAESFFKLLLAYQLGKPVQPSIQADTREFAPPLTRGDTPSYFERSRDAAGSHKPN